MQTQQLEQVEKKISNLEQTVNQGRITTQDTYDRSADLLRTVKSMQSEPIIIEARGAVEAAHEAHDLSLKVWHRLIDPLLSMERILKQRILAWDRQKQEEEDERKRKAETLRLAEIRAEQDRLDREAREKARAAAKAASEQARKDGESKFLQEQARKKAEADELARTQAENAERIAAMENAPTKEVKQSYERASNVVTRDNWTAEFPDGVRGVMQLVLHVAKNPSDLYLLEPEKLIESHPNLTKLAKAQKSMMTLPGVRAVNKGVVAASR
jgi:hypothetical protein